MLTRIGLKNFKVHAETSLDAVPLTVFIGPNGSGKSSIFQSLLLWRQSATRNSSGLCLAFSRQASSEVQPYLFPADQLIDIGDFDQVVRRGQREVSISVSGNYQPDKAIEYGPGLTNANFEVRILENRLVYHRGDLGYEVQTLNMRGRVQWEWVWGRQTGPASPTISLLDGNAKITLQPQESLALLGGSGFTQSGPILPEKQIAIQRLIERFQGSALKLLGSIHPIFPLRGFEEVRYPLAEASGETVDRMALSDRTTRPPQRSCVQPSN